ncbi:Ankyrin repeat [Fusarium oxysporum f. sp. vasinfectum]|nr:Ankyrin repeat [Fusarium oxysporum f. sp. vasinfectum]
MDVVETLLKRDGIDVDFTDDDGRTLMSWIVSFNSSREVVGGFRDLAERRIAGLLYQKSNSLLNHPDRDGRTPLSWAAEQGDPAVVEWLLDQPGIELNSKCKLGRTPLFWALSNPLPFGSLSDHRVRYLLETPGIEKHSWDNEGRTLLSWAAGSAQEQAADYLLADENIDVNVADNDGWTPLAWATMKGNERIVEQLLASKHRVDVNLADKNGRTPLYWAVQKKHYRIVDMLLSRDLVTLCSAARKGDLATVKSLAYAGYDVKRTNLLNQTPLHSAILSGNYEIAEFLLSRTTAINGGDNEGMTPLRSAIQQRRVGLVELLLKHSAETKEIKLYEWFEAYNLTGSFYVCLTENGGEKTLSVARVNEIASSNEAMQGPRNRSSEKRFFLFKNSLPWQKGLIRDSIEILQPNKLHLSESKSAESPGPSGVARMREASQCGYLWTSSALYKTVGYQKMAPSFLRSSWMILRGGGWEYVTWQKNIFPIA